MEELKLEVTRLTKALFAAFDSGDYEKCATFYDPDVVMLPPGGDFVKGQDDVAATFKGMKESGVAKLVCADIVMVTKMSDDYVVSHGYDDTYDSAGKRLGRFKDMVVWKRNDNKWYLWRDMFNGTE